MELVKFLYATDLRLDRPLALGEGAWGFAPRAGDVAYEATRRLIDCALSRGVEAVFLRGELCDARSGAKALLFLIEQTSRLSSAGIACHILNEGAAFDARWLAGFPPNVKWLQEAASMEAKLQEAALIEAALIEATPMEAMLRPLQGLNHDESGPHGAWLISLPDGVRKEPEREFIELDALRWERCEMDVTRIETEEDLVASWKAVKDGFRERERESVKDRPTLLHLKLTGAMSVPSVFYGEEFTRGPGNLMKKLNAEESARKNFILINSLSDETLSQSLSLAGADAYEADFWGEMTFFKSGIDLRVGLFEALKERGILKRLLATDAASALENITEADVESLLKESHNMAFDGLHHAGGPK